MDDDVIQVAVGLRLGANLCEFHMCTCGVPVDARGTHGLGLQEEAQDVTPAHGLLNDVVWRAMLRESRSRPARNQARTQQVRREASRRGLADPLVTRPLCDLGRHVASDTLAPSHLQSSATQAGSAAEARAEAAKTLKYSALAITHVFVPLAFETLGAWGVEAAAFVAELGRRMTAATGDSRETSFLRQRLSVAIQRGNAIACRGTMPGVAVPN